MLSIDCPWCGAREQTEFAYGGEAHIVRPPNSESLSDGEWGDYVFHRANPRGAHFERWNHAFGCRRWFHLARDCPWCGAREQTEFAYGGEAHIVRPPNSESLSDGEWGDYVFHRANPRGAHFERWNHAFGCPLVSSRARHGVGARLRRVSIADSAAVAAPESESNSDSRPAAAQAAK